MTIINADAKALEVVCAAYLSQDQVMMNEIINKVDIHSANQEAFKIPRLIAKILAFRIIYGGSAYSFSKDPDFAEISTSEKYWEGIIEKFYDKYKGLAKWHGELLRQAVSTGRIITPTGRVFQYEAKKNFRGELVWPSTTIKNYPVQSIGADLMSIARVSFYKRFKDAKIEGKLVNTVHDSLIVDANKKDLDQISGLFHEVFLDIPNNFERLFKVALNIPLTVEVSFGQNMKELEVWTEKNMKKNII
jgi:DNA polymerase I-like protein with 3'-5' exonuclease and polymerase domains